MMTTILKPIKPSRKEIILLSNSINSFLKDIIYNNIVINYKDIFKNNLRINDINNINNLLKNNDLYIKGSKLYSSDNKWSLKLIKELESLGCIYYKQDNSFINLPNSFNSVIVEKQKQAKEFLDFLNEYTNKILKDLENKINYFNYNFSRIIGNYNKQLNNNLNEYTENHTINNNLNKELDKQLNKEYTNTLKRKITNLSQRQTEKLRRDVKDYILNKGYNNNTIASLIQDNYKLTKKQSNFIARNESSFLLAKYNKLKAKELNLDTYIWTTAHDERVREDHKILDGHRFKFDYPPIADKRTNQRANPGELYNCRCLAQIVLD